MIHITKTRAVRASVNLPSGLAEFERDMLRDRAGRCLVQAALQPTGRGQRQQRIYGCLHYRAASAER